MSSYFGLDLGASSLKVCQIQPMGNQYRLDAVGLIQNPVGSLDFSKQEHRQQLAVAVKQVLKEADIRERRVVAAIPESQVYSRVVSMPTMSDAELASAIQWEAEQFVPVPIDEVEMDYTVVHRPAKGSVNEKMLVYLVASQKQYLQSFVDFIVEVGLEPIAVESEMVALARAYQMVVDDSVGMVLQLGALSTSFCILSGQSLMFSYATPVGGVALTRALAQTLSLPLAQAEQYKRAYGLDNEQLEGKVRQSILVVFQSIISEVRKALEFYSATYNTSVTRLFLSGGGAYMPELVSYLSQELQGMEVVVGDPFVRAKVGKNIQLPEERAVYGVAVGLAARTF